MWLNLALVEDSLRTIALGRRLVYLTSTHSTQDVARSEAEMGADEGTVVLAEEQTAGRGRLGRAWVSPAGRNIYLTLVLRPDVQHLKALTMIAPLAVARAVEEVTGLSPQLKWPNDILLSGRKLSGVLIDSEFSGSEVRYALVGIGLNVNFDIDKTSEIGSPPRVSSASWVERFRERDCSRRCSTSSRDCIAMRTWWLLGKPGKQGWRR